jgi:hypothetical protein
MASVGVAVVTVPLAFGIGALGNLVGTGTAGIDQSGTSRFSTWPPSSSPTC